MKKLLATIAIAGFAVIGISTPAAAAPNNPNMNHESYWETSTTDCVKVEFADGVESYSLPTLTNATYTMLILKAGSGELAHQVILWPIANVDYFHQTSKDLSHAIYCTMEGIRS